MLVIGLILGVLVGLPALLAAYLTQPLFFVSRRPSALRVDPERLRSTVEALATARAPRTFRHVSNLDRAAESIAAGLAAAGAAVSFQPFDVEGRAYRNVIASLGPDAGERIVVGAHYDAASSGIGADDNASGVAGLIELASLLRGASPSTPIELVAYTLEEPPYFGTRSMGSSVHASALRRSGAPVRAMIALEMIGYFSDEPGSQRFPFDALSLLYPSRGDFIAVVGCVGQAGLVRTVKRAMSGASDLGVRSINAPRLVPGVDLSDHASYWDEGFPAVMVTDTAFFRNRNYHTPDDTPDTLDYRRMALVVEGVFAAVKALGE